MTANTAAMPATKPQSEINWATLVAHLREKTCVLVLGPSVLCGKNEKGEEVPIRRMLAQQIGQKIEEINEARNPGQPRQSLPDPGDLALMSSLYKQEKTGSDTEFGNLLQEFFKKFTQPTERLIELSKLPFRAILNTTPDNLMKKAYSKSGVLPEFKFYPIGEGKPLDVEAREGVPLVYNLFGSLEERNSLVLSQAHQMEFLDKIKAPDTGLPPGLRVILKQAKSVVFFGFDFENWYMKVFLHLLNLNSEAENILAIHYTGSQTSPPPPLTRKFFDLQYRMKFVELLPDEFVKTLHDKYAESNGKDKTSGPIARRKLLFLHHVDDLEAREKMQEILKPVLNAFHFEVIDWFEAGDIDERMEENIASAEVIVPLVSTSFDVDEKIGNLWLQKALDRNGDNCFVIPLKVRPVASIGQLWASMPSLLPGGGKSFREDEAALQALPNYFRELFQDNYDL